MGAGLADGKKAHSHADRSGHLIEGSIADHLRSNARRWPQRPALFWLDTAGAIKRLSHSELLEQSEAVARWLLERVEPGSRIAILSTNNVDYAVLLKASALAGTIIVPFNTGWSDAEIVHALAMIEPSLVLVGRDMRGDPLRPRVQALATCTVMNLEGLRCLLPADPQRDLPAVRPGDPYLIQFTSGTTGRSKGALLSQYAALAGGYLVMGEGRPSERDVWLIPVPFHHIAGSCSIPLCALAVGGAFVVLERFVVETMIELMKSLRPSRMGGVPTMWHDLLRHPAFPEDVKLDLITLGGAKVPPALVMEIERRTGAAVTIGYGQSECGAITATRADDDIATKAETVGPALPHVEIKIIDPTTGATLCIGEVGELCTISPAVMIGYWNDPEATAAVLAPDGFLRTGDLASMDVRGVCRIHGRTGEMIIRGGENIYPTEIEEALLSHPAVARVGVIGLADLRLGHRVAAAVELVPGASTTIDELRAHAAARIAHFKLPVEWRLVGGLPMTASGKVRKVDLPILFAPEGASA